MEKEYKGSYKGTPIIEGDWVAVVDTEKRRLYISTKATSKQGTSW